MFAFEVEYLLGRSFAGDFRDRSASEWPPHPGRLYSALAAAYFENGEDAREKAALEWLERQHPPHIRAGDAGEPTLVQAFVPTNYPGDGPPALRGKQPRVFPAQGPSEAVVYFIWPDAEVPVDTVQALNELAARTGYLGKACSMVRMCVTHSAPEPNYLPHAEGSEVLRVPAPGRLAELAWLFDAGQQASAGAQHRYRKKGAQTTSAATPSCFGQMIVFRRTSGPRLPIDASLTLTGAVRQALMSNAGRGGPMSETIHGHHGGEGTHCAVTALPFVGGDHGDGHLLGFAIVPPRGANPEDRRAILSACDELMDNGLNIPGIGNWDLEPADESALQVNLRARTWTHGARTWSSVTPILMDRFPKKKGPGVEQIVAASCVRIGLPEPVRVEHGPYSKIAGVPSVPAFRLQRSREERPRWGVHATVEFAMQVRGPVLLGAGRFFGLGLMRPEQEVKADD